VMVRDGANTVGIDDLKTTRFVGDIWNDDVLREAMAGCDVVYYCVVDTRGWLKDPAPLFHTNVEGTRNVLEVAKDAGLRRFIFTSSYVTVGRRRGRVATEDDTIALRGEMSPTIRLRGEMSPTNRLRGVTPYVRSRVQAEELVLRYAREHGLPAIAMCVSTTYVGVDDVARALILAAEKGRVGERYLVSEKMVTNTDVARIAAEAAGVAPPARSIPLAMSYALAAMGTAKARLRGTDEQLSLASLRLMRAEAPVDCTKARRELGWQPRRVEDSIREAAQFWVSLRDAKRKSRQGG
jgi:dihydroflavonol-4-reductase